MPTPKIPPPENDEPFYWIPDKLRDAYHISLGRFIDAFSNVENSLAGILRKFIQQRMTGSYELTIALTGSMRIKPLSDTIIRVVKAANISEIDQEIIKLTLNHLGDILFVRDRLIHNAGNIEFFDDRWVITTSNHNQVNDNKKISKIELSIETLENMTTDLWIIVAVLRMAMNPNNENEISLLSSLKPPTWQYKPSSLKHRQKSSFYN